ncbi:hypothetical protein B0J15DRAFT_456841 [Fusarium solani]|uniref:Zn(2)-C6 fungal-type domain-containing protein n=1 Tax=Fusarium solani TaxID=169388 RepID=A0A9P9FWR8_FUSSL|nr:uncharacterized protein B0J15DRAFT_456841 [Fusarium solani]KAH7224246.1 hypothetical protein B0J15DRAFT_456841 [Fusarium solani]
MDPPQPPTDKTSAQDSDPKKPSRKNRKRARRACLTCRARKVRCDVSQKGSPCTNCHLDGERCLVKRRTSKYRRAHDALLSDPQAPVPIEEDMSDEEDIEMILGSASATDKAFGPQGGLEPIPGFARASEFSTRINDISKPPGTDFYCQRPNAANVAISSEVVYCRYPFLGITDIHRIPQQDVRFLELQGCLKVPTRPLLDEFVQQYCLHVHPILPVVNEGDFWDLYDHDSSQPPRQSFPLLLFQAMLFAASTFVSKSTVRALSYSDNRSLRTTLLRRTKLLYDLETESSPLVIAQASILLSMASLSSSGKPNTIWLSLAIENAKLAEAHLYTSLSAASHFKERNVLKRLWWCCVMRDRSMGLLLKRPINITREQFDTDEDPLSANDLRDELQRSKVYSPSTKWKLAEILSQSVQLYIKLTDVLMVLHPPRGRHQSTQKSRLHPLYECKSALREWNSRTSLRLSDLQNNPDLRTSSKTDQAKGQDSIILYRNLMYMYYHTARIGLCHHEALHWEGNELGLSLPKDLSTISETQRELQRAISDITECHKELLRLDLAQWLPSSAMGFSTLPLILNILDTKLSPPATEGVQQSSALVQHRLNVLIEFMRAYWARYDGVDWISEIVRHIVGLTQLNGSRVQRKTPTINWTDIFAFQPRSYLRLVLVFDFSLSKGRLAQDSDFPVNLRGLFSVNLNPLKDLVEGRYTSLPRYQQPSPSSPFDSILRDQVLLHILGIDDCLVNSLENDIAFHQLTDTNMFQRPETVVNPGHLLNQPAIDLTNEIDALPNELDNSETSTTDWEENTGAGDSDRLVLSGLDNEGMTDEGLADHLLEAIPGDGLGEGISSG